ncbi:hypothetical protein NGM37_58855 [Streptomyces sp. TRM76130]|nr:hypothetical protein [Streptomyces sp. TRM76130]
METSEEPAGSHSLRRRVQGCGGGEPGTVGHAYGRAVARAVIAGPVVGEISGIGGVTYLLRRLGGVLCRRAGTPRPPPAPACSCTPRTRRSTPREEPP